MVPETQFRTHSCNNSIKRKVLFLDYWRKRSLASLLGHSNGVLAGTCGEMHTDNQGLWTRALSKSLLASGLYTQVRALAFSWTHSVFFCPRTFVLPLPSTSTTLLQILQVWLLLIVNSHQKCHVLREKDPATLLYVGLLHYVHHLPWFISVCYFSLFKILILFLLNVSVPSLYLPPPTLNMNSGAHLCHCRGLRVGNHICTYWICTNEWRNSGIIEKKLLSTGGWPLIHLEILALSIRLLEKTNKVFFPPFPHTFHVLFI